MSGMDTNNSDSDTELGAAARDSLELINESEAAQQLGVDENMLSLLIQTQGIVFDSVKKLEEMTKLVQNQMPNPTEMEPFENRGRILEETEILLQLVLSNEKYMKILKGYVQVLWAISATKVKIHEEQNN